ncbi:MAG: AraC family transcriptional regulator [Henriciella sp.]|nr:AraC family transcriptional regulator [Henriciella sp.]
MGKITSLFVHKVIAQVSPGVETGDVLEALGLDAQAPVDPAVMVASDAYYDMFAELARRDPEGATLPLRVGASMRCDDYGAFGFAWKTATTLAGSYDRAERYGRRLTTVSSYTVAPAVEGAFVHLHRAGERRLGLRLSNEATIASSASISGEVARGPFKPLAVYFRHDRPQGPPVHETHFRCPVHFGADRDALLVSTESLTAPNKLSDKGLSAYFDEQLRAEKESQTREAVFDQQVRQTVAQGLSDGVPTLSGVAEALGVGTRTLQRRLAAQDQSFQTVVDAVRRELSRELLRDTDYSLAEIAFLTGFSEQSGFTRAFKRWSGETPRSYRLAAQ